MMMGVATGVLSNDKIGLWWKASISNVSALRRELARFFSWNFLNLTMSGLMGQVPQLLLGGFRGPEEAGFFRLATSFMTAGSYLENSLGKVSYPILAAKWEIGDRGNLNRTLKHWTLQMGLPACFLISITIPLLSILIPEILGYSYGPMVIGTQIMMVGIAASALFFWLNSCYYALGMVGQWTKLYSLYAALSIGVGFLAIYGWGFIGVGVVTGMGKIIFTGVMVGLFLMDRERSRESFRLSESK
jgi:O-antigen/teichoic acid export membrane protein